MSLPPWRLALPALLGKDDFLFCLPSLAAAGRSVALPPLLRVLFAGDVGGDVPSLESLSLEVEGARFRFEFAISEFKDTTADSILMLSGWS